MVVPALRHGGYTLDLQAYVCKRPGGGRHMVDILATSRNNEKLLISLKWQQTSGTAEQKVPFEVICLADAILNSNGAYSRAYLVLGGEGWKLKDFYTSGGLNAHLVHGRLVRILGLEAFVTLANKAAL